MDKEGLVSVGRNAQVAIIMVRNIQSFMELKETNLIVREKHFNFCQSSPTYEAVPVADSSIDVIISNCVINLSPEKSKVFQESFRVLKPGGRLAVSDVVATADLPEDLKSDMALYAGCFAGASSISAIEKMLKDAGFDKIVIKPKDESRKFIRNWFPGKKIEDYVVSATIEAVKPNA